ncbi:O-antigen ligase family protein [uncultured Aquimarina sp.]|uniref:O-antigen ligase family protein n=1 Tax=uncultured Aquimarina sp. TaxID=575652 RepID=UPI0026119DA2|nr:O-antigen ligase family protein [uncultured Aquimarina sp.]
MVVRLNLKKTYYTRYFLPLVLGLIPIVAVFVGENIVPLFIILSGILFLFEKSKKENVHKTKSLLLPYLIYILVYIFYTIISSDISLALKQIERQIAIMLIPIIIFFSSWNIRRINFFLETYLIALILVCVFSLIKLSHFYFIWSDWVEISKPSYFQYKFPHLLNAHPTYWSYLLIFGNAILLSNSYFKIEVNKYFSIFTIILFNCILLLLSARTPLLINLLVHIFALVIYFHRFRNQTNLKIKIFFIVIGSGLGLLLFINNSSFFVTKVQSISEDERFFLWPKAMEEIKNNYFIWGEGVGQGNEVLKLYLEKIEDTRINYKQHDLHNQFLKNYLDMGILGFLSLLFLIVYPIFNIKKYFEFNYLLVYSHCLIFLVGTNTESVLYVLKGIILFAVFSPFVILISRSEEYLLNS